MLRSTRGVRASWNRAWGGQIKQRLINLYPLLIFQEEYFGLLSEPFRCFRNLAVQEPASDVETDADSVFSSAASVSSSSSTGSSYSTRSVSRYRQRYGRGGRVYLDRTLTMDEKENLEKTQLKEMLENPILEERLRYDPRACEDEKPVIL